MTDIEIAQRAKLLKINEIAEKIGLTEDEYEQYGKYKAKVELSVLEKYKDKKDGKLIKEADLAVKFRNAVLHYLQQDKSIITRTDGYGKTNLSLNEAAKLIDGADLSIEWHLNASSNPTATGVETIALPKDKVLAQKISSVVAQAFELKLRGQDGWIDQSESARGKLLFVSKGGLIGELGFINSTKDLEAFESRYWVAAKAVAEVMIEYVKSKK